MANFIRTSTLALVGTLLLTVVTSAQGGILIGDNPTAGNIFPFTSDGVLATPGTRYQQVYDSSFFSGITTINSLTFFNTSTAGAVFTEADYSFSLSTSRHPVDALNTTDLDDNPGSDAVVFATVHLSGPTGSSFTIVAGAGGGSTFTYDPSAGDLLVDIVRTNIVADSGSGSLDSYNGDANGIFSRAQNYGLSNAGWGLTTEFGVEIQAVPEPSTMISMALGLSMAGLYGLRRRHAARVS